MRKRRVGCDGVVFAMLGFWSFGERLDRRLRMFETSNSVVSEVDGIERRKAGRSHRWWRGRPRYNLKGGLWAGEEPKGKLHYWALWRPKKKKK